MNDYLTALAANLDHEPCRCVQTDRGTDDSACRYHGEESVPAAVEMKRAGGIELPGPEEL